MAHRCEQCGREGTREFTTYGGFWHHGHISRGVEPTWFPFVTLCTNTKACQKRRPRPDDDELDALYA